MIHHRACTPATAPGRKQGAQSIGHCLTERQIHACASENPAPRWLSPYARQTHNLESADAFRPGEQGKTVIADKAHDVRSRVIGTLLTTGTEVVPSCGKEQREDDVDLYKAHHAIENFFEPVQSLPVRG